MITATDTLYPTDLAYRGGQGTPIPITMILCPACDNLFAVVSLWPQNAPAQCCYCGEPMRFNSSAAGVMSGNPTTGGLCHE
jgi:hypothetical protein